MELKIRNAAGTLIFLSALPATAQETAAKVTTTAACASCPPAYPPAIVVPPDPTWFIAGFIVGVVVGFVAAKVLSGKKTQ